MPGVRIPTFDRHVGDWQPGHSALLAFLNNVSHNLGSASSTRSFPGYGDGVPAGTDDLGGIWGTRGSYKEIRSSLLAGMFLLQDKMVLRVISSSRFPKVFLWMCFENLAET